jgi:molybdopterin/thiamine biosynthesis adenylyltransferase
MSKDTRESVTAESVLIVGAGQFGLTVALELVRFGVRDLTGADEPSDAGA